MSAMIPRILSLLGLLALLSISTAYSQPDPSLALSTAEREWLQQHPVIRIGIDRQYMPVEQVVDGEYSGISADYVARVSELLGVRFEVVSDLNWSDTIRKIHEREIDMLAAVNQTNARDTYLNFSQPYLVMDTAIITSAFNQDDLSIDDLDGRKVALVAGYHWYDFITAQHPDINIIPVPDLVTGLQEVAFGTTHAMLATLAASSHYLNERNITNLRAAGLTPYASTYHFGVRKDWPILVGILDKALQQITPAQRQEIMAHWVRLQDLPSTEHSPYTTAITTIAAIFLLLLLISTAWSYSLRRQVQAKTQHLERELAQHQQTQHELQQAANELEMRVEQRTADLNDTVNALFKSQQELEESNQRLKNLANCDGLTQIANRRHLDKAMNSVLKSTRKNQLPLTFILGDLDYFKAYNDRYGHQMGDECLCAIADCLSQYSKRNGELAARYGGEEFALLLPGTDSTTAHDIAQHILASVEALQIEHCGSKISDVVTISLGLVSLTPDADTSTADLIRAADAALYRAKSAGRNNAQFATPETADRPPE